MQLPAALLSSLETVNGFDKDAFVQVHASGEQITSVRINPGKCINENADHLSFITSQAKVPWTTFGHYLPQRPSFTFDPLFHAGCYYVQEASSMFLEQALKQIANLEKPLRVLDLCAAPGGKSTHLLSLLSQESLLVSNEVIRSRVNILNDNIIKWGNANVVVTNNDPRDFQRLENYFDVIVVDAPCSGSGLFRREPEAIDEWSEHNVALCSQRQQRILSDVLPALKNDGLLIYSTCSYSQEEDEQVCEWLQQELNFKKEILNIDSDWGIVESEGGYRFWPDKVKGEGFFLACFRKPGGEDIVHKKKNNPEKFSAKDLQALQQFVKTDDLTFFYAGKNVHAIPLSLIEDAMLLVKNLKVINSGIRIGELIREKLVPDHALAMSKIIAAKVPAFVLDKEQAIQYLKKKDLQLNSERKGWCLVTYKGNPLGWINILPNRINNYYPKELRILKD